MAFGKCPLVLPVTKIASEKKKKKKKRSASRTSFWSLYLTILYSAQSRVQWCNPFKISLVRRIFSSPVSLNPSINQGHCLGLIANKECVGSPFHDPSLCEPLLLQFCRRVRLQIAAPRALPLLSLLLFSFSELHKITVSGAYLSIRTCRKESMRTH